MKSENNLVSDCPKVSVIINCFNGAKYLSQAIDSVYAQTYKDWEIIFWDNASTDASPEIARAYDARLKYFKSAQTAKLGKARNWAVEKASGIYIAFLDSDDVWFPKKLEMQVPLLDNNPRVGMAYCDAVVFRGNKDLYSFYKKDKPVKGQVFGELITNYALPILTVVIRKESLFGLTYWFDDNLTMDEDMDLFLRLAHDWDVDYVDEPLAKYRMHAENESYKNTYYIAKEEEIIVEKLIALYPDVSSKYSRQVKLLKEKINCHKALGKWCDGNKKDARGYLRPYILKKKTCLIIYFMTIFPYGFFRFLNQLYYKLKYGI